jgi:hypothetical protein
VRHGLLAIEHSRDVRQGVCIVAARTTRSWVEPLPSRVLSLERLDAEGNARRGVT